jgi:hypothetical protein
MGWDGMGWDRIGWIEKDISVLAVCLRNDGPTPRCSGQLRHDQRVDLLLPLRRFVGLAFNTVREHRRLGSVESVKLRAGVG